MPDGYPMEPPIMPPIEIGLITLSNGLEIEVKPIPASGADYVDYQRKVGYAGDCTLKLAIADGQSPIDIAALIKTALEIELVSKTKQDHSLQETITIIKAQINAMCQSTILAKFSLIHQLDVANGLYADKGMKAWIADMIIESNRCHELIDTKTTIEEVKAVAPNWPVYVEV